MLRLLDTGWIANRYGKWRWVHYAAAGIMLFAIGWAVSELLLVPRKLSPTADTSMAGWTLVGFSVASLLLFGYSAWLSYIDETRLAYEEVAQRYRTEGW
jgi:hypothetical protein